MDNEMSYSEIGMVTAQKIDEIGSHWDGVKVIASVVMPNHVHLIISIDGEIYQTRKIPTSEDSSTPKIASTVLTATPRRGPTVGGLHSYLAVIVGGFKAGVKREAKQHGLSFEWQSGYHDHIIRDTESFNKIMDYINNNVYRWSDDCYNN